VWIIDDVRIGERESLPDLGLPFTDDMESGDSGWEPGGQWVLVGDDAHSPEHAWSMNPGEENQRNTDFALKLAGLIAVPGDAVNPNLTYYDRIEAASDTTLQVEATTNDGLDWIVLQNFGAADNTADWTLREIALTDYIGETIGIRCRAIQGSSWSVDTWLIDDVWVGDDAPAPTASSTPTDTATEIATATATPSSTPEPSATKEGTETPTPTATEDETATPEATSTYTPTPTPTPTPTSLAANGTTGSVVMAAIVLKPVGENTSSMPAPAPQAGEVVTRVIDYSYDPLYRLTAADYDDGTFFHYSYDSVGNRLTQETLAGTNSYVYDIANRLIEVDGVSYTWDANGNLLNDGMRTYTYNSANRLVGVAQGGDAYSFAYNGLGDRLQQTVNGTRTNYTLDINRDLTQVLHDGTNAYLYGLERIGEAQPDGWQYHLTDGLISVRQLSNPAAVIFLSKVYKPFGGMLGSLGNVGTVYGFTGELTDPTGLIYLRTRYLETSTGRFIQADPVVGTAFIPLSLHPYLYANDNPLKYVDPQGTQSIIEKVLESLRDKAEACFNAGDLDCVWRCYKALAIGGNLLGYKHASDHMNRFLHKKGDIFYHPIRSSDAPDTSDWIRTSPSVVAERQLIEQEMLFLVHGTARRGTLVGKVVASQRPVDPDPETEKDLYYSMNIFTLWADASFEIKGCYELTLRPTYHFRDPYDWHAGLAAGGAVPGLAGFKDEWAAALHDAGLALEYGITGYWKGPNKIFLLPTNWLNLDVAPPALSSSIIPR
jgi:RHS repeat-associated protein